MIAVWLLSPGFWNTIGNDSRDWYAAGRVAARGGNVYDQDVTSAEQARLNEEARSQGSGRSSITSGPYHYPPIMTRGFQLLASLGDTGFLVVFEAFLLVAALVGFELTLAGLAWRGRWWPRLLFLTSLPLFEVLATADPAAVLLLSWGAAFLAFRSGRLTLAGALLAVGLIKIPVGVPVAIALILAAPVRRSRLLLGLALGAAAFVGVNLASGPPESVAWVRSLVPYTATINVHQSDVLPQCCLAGLSAPFLGLGPVWANLIAFLLVAAPVAWLYRSGALLDLWRRRPTILLGLLVSAALAVTPYVHPYDLILEAVPLLVLASLPLTYLNRTVFALWALSVPISLLLVLSAHLLIPDANALPWSFGVALSAATFAALVVATARAHQGSSLTAESPAITQASV